MIDYNFFPPQEVFHFHSGQKNNMMHSVVFGYLCLERYNAYAQNTAHLTLDFFSSSVCV